MYHSDLFSVVYIEHMVRNMEFLTESILRSPDQAIRNIDILSGEEKDLPSTYLTGSWMAELMTSFR